jgi:hypothetical protein
MTDHVFRDGELFPINSPIEPDAKGCLDTSLKAVGLDYPITYGYEHSSPSIKIYGPANDGFQYRYLIEIDLCLGVFEWIWCAGIKDLHGYLIYAAPLISSIQMLRITETLATAERWLFDPTDGIFGQHVRDREREAIWRAEQRRKQKANTHGTPTV